MEERGGFKFLFSSQRRLLIGSTKRFTTRAEPSRVFWVKLDQIKSCFSIDVSIAKTISHRLVVLVRFYLEFLYVCERVCGEVFSESGGGELRAAHRVGTDRWSWSLKMEAVIEKECSALGGLFQTVIGDMKVRKFSLCITS